MTINDRLTPNIRSTIAAIQKREMLLPLLLFVAGHRPCTFLAGQTLHLFSPMAALLGLAECREWAELLSHPGGSELLEAYLESRLR
ncbi:hypothetical protein KFU94_27630 [Chloroflexi bacterium TSY]|nr:hypothetical protein [Chloroflexi bacterium TSY]